jgi:hypothetical protein
MNLPEWATHVAVDEDGEMTAFDRKPVFIAPTAHTCGMWVLPNREHGRIKVVAEPAQPNAALLPLGVAREFCVAIPRPEREESEP